MNRPVPEADPAAYAHMKYELENREKQGVASHMFGIFRQHPDARLAAKSGTPNMEGLRPQIPASVPSTAAGAGALTADVSAQTVTDTSVLDKNPDARANPPGQNTVTAAAATPTTNQADSATPQQPLPSNHTVPAKKQKKQKKGKQTAPAADATTTPAPQAPQQ